MDETILPVLKEMNNSALQKLFNAESGKVRNQRLENVQNSNLAQNEARRTDCAVIVKNSTPFLLEHLNLFRSIIRKLRKAKENGKEDGIRDLTNHLHEQDIVRGDYGVQGRCDTRDIDNIPWYDQTFYINRFTRFYVSRDSSRYICND